MSCNSHRWCNKGKSNPEGHISRMSVHERGLVRHGGPFKQKRGNVGKTGIDGVWSSSGQVERARATGTRSFQGVEVNHGGLMAAAAATLRAVALLQSISLRSVPRWRVPAGPGRCGFARPAWLAHPCGAMSIPLTSQRRYSLYPYFLRVLRGFAVNSSLYFGNSAAASMNSMP